MTQSALTNIHEVIAATDEKFTAAFNRGDAAGVAKLYTEQGQVLLSNFDVITGRLGIQMIWQGTMLMGNKGMVLEIIEVEEHGEIAYEVGKYTLLTKGGKVTDMGKYIAIWKQEEGEWKLHRDMINSNKPAPGQLPNPISAILKLMRN
jgi:ketosteroid isomerase-like protein